MMPNATIDTGTVSEKRVLQSTKRQRNDAEYEHCIPSGYMTGDEFERRVIERLEKSYREYGLL